MTETFLTSQASQAYHPQQDGSIRLSVRVQPRASRARIDRVVDGRLRIYLTAAPTEGKANAQLIELLAKQLGINKSSIKLLRGLQSRNKELIIQSTSLPGGIL